ncbi:MAG: 30S ribosomal protein S2 [Candidatus Yanofskybacteria bacterium]|nr:30S ribosomal protein S2 [Candidatus Yanofskybacteria bacterium]
MTDSEKDLLIPYEDMLQAGMHFGRKRTVFNPKMGQYVFSVRDGICLIDLLKTQTALRAAIDALNKTLQEGGLVLFVAPTKQSQESMRALADAANMPYVMDRWLGGTLTNFKVINTRVKRLIQLEEDKAAGRWEKYTKKEQLELSRELIEMKRNFEGLKKLVRMPDLVVVASVREGALAIHEAVKMGVKVISIANTDANPAGLLQVIPANDRSKKSVDLIVGAIRDNLQTQAA